MQFALARPLAAEEQAIVGNMVDQIKAYDKKLGFSAVEQDGFVDIPPEYDAETGEVIDPMK